MGVLPVAVEVEGADGVGDQVEDAEDPACDVSPRELLDTAELHNDSNEIEQSGNGGVEQLSEEPVDGEVDGALQVQKVDETPQGRRHEGCDDDEEEPVCAVRPGRGGAGHAEDADHQFDDLDDSRGRLEVLEAQRDPRRLLWGGVGRRGRHRGRHLGFGVGLGHHVAFEGSSTEKLREEGEEEKRERKKEGWKDVSLRAGVGGTSSCGRERRGK